MKKRTPALIALFILCTFLISLSEMADQFPPGARPYILAGSIFGMSIAATLGIPTGKRYRFRKLGALALAFLLLAQTACFGASVLKVVKSASEEVAVNLAGAGSLINALALEGSITPEVAAEKRAAFARLSEKYAALDAGIQAVKKIDAAAALALLPAAEGFARQLAAENLIPQASPEVMKRFESVRTVLQIVVDRIVARLRSRSVSVARFSPSEFKQIKREADAFKSDSRQLSDLLAA